MLDVLLQHVDFQGMSFCEVLSAELHLLVFSRIMLQGSMFSLKESKQCLNEKIIIL